MTKLRSDLAEAEVDANNELVKIRKVLNDPTLEFRTLRQGPNNALEYLIEVSNKERRSIPKSCK